MNAKSVELRNCGVRVWSEKAVGIADVSECTLGKFPLTWIPKSQIKRIEKQTDSFAWYHVIEVTSWFYQKNLAALSKFNPNVDA